MQAGVQAAGHHSRGGCCPAHGLCRGPGFQAETPPWLCSLGCKDKAEFPGFGKPWEQRHFPALPKMCCWRVWPLQSHPGLLEKQRSRGAALLSDLLPCLGTPTLGTTPCTSTPAQTPLLLRELTVCLNRTRKG